MDESEAKRLLVSQVDLRRADGTRVDVISDLSDEEIEHILHIDGDNLVDYQRFRQRAEHQADLRKQYDGGGGKTSRILRGATQIALLAFCCLVFPFGITYVVKSEYAGLAALVSVVGGLIFSVFALRSLYDWWPCEGDKARTKHREWQAKGEYGGVSDYTPWWQGLLAWLGGMVILFALALAAAWCWKWLEQYAARH
jgi:hypothetical protein